MIWRKKRDSTGSEAIAGAAVEGVAAKAAGGTGVHHAGPGPARSAQGATPSNSDVLSPTAAGEGLDFQAIPDTYTSQRRYAIPRSYRVRGHLVSSRPIAIQGEMAEGQVVSRLVTVLPGGSVGAVIKADTVQVAGDVAGDIRARVVDVSSMGHITGSVDAGQMRVLPGARLAGSELKIG